MTTAPAAADATPTATAAVPPAKLPLLVALPVAVAVGFAILMYFPHTTPEKPIEMPAGTLFPALRIAVMTTMRLPVYFLFFLCGLGLGWVQPRFWFLLGLSTIAVLPAVALVEMAQDRASHPIWPIEFMMYACMALPAIAGAAIARMRRYREVAETPSAIF